MVSTSGIYPSNYWIFRKLGFYDSYLPLIVTEDRYNKVSAKGYTYGYIGSVLLLIAILILIMVQNPNGFGFSDAGYASRIGFVMVGLWWLGFSQYTFKHLPKDALSVFSRK